MYNVGFRIVNNTEEAEDVLQEAFISAFRNLHHYRGDSTFGAWLKRIVINKAINYLHKKKTERMPEDEHWDIGEAEVENILEGFPFTVEQVRGAIERCQMDIGRCFLCIFWKVMIMPRLARLWA
jgi:RNA polymerase sigma factor (sigma-70 family)